MAGITVDVAGRLLDGKEAHVFTLINKRGAQARITNYGGIVLSLSIPDRNGVMGDVVLGYKTFEGYLDNSPYFGCLVGRFGNRIAKGQFSLGGKTYQLAVNNPPNALHGGIKGFHKVLWAASPKMSAAGPAVGLNYISRDGEEGYPGTMSVTAVYTLTDDNALELEFTATTDKPTVVNLTHHSYFNLACRGDVLGHEVVINADRFTPIDPTLIPTGELRSVAGTPLDFRTPMSIGARIESDDPQMKFGNGYDHNWVLNKPLGKLGLAASVVEPVSGRVMEVHTTAPGTQFYTGNFLDGTIVGKNGWVYQKRNGFCFEPQHFPDSPNRPDFPGTVLNVGETYSNTIIYRFSTLK